MRQCSVVAGLHVLDAEYAELFKAEPFLRHSPSKIPSMTTMELWAVPTVGEWGKAMRKHQAKSRRSYSTSSHQVDHYPRSGDAILGDRFERYCELEAILASLNEVRGTVSWSNSLHQFETLLIQFYEKHLKSKAGSDIFCLETLWHSVFISLLADINRLELASGREGYETAQEHVGYAQTWAKSPEGRRCALHGVLILRRLENQSMGAEPAIHVPRVLYYAAMVWYCYTKFGENAILDDSGPNQTKEYPEMKSLGVYSQKLLFEAHGFKNSPPRTLESITLCALIDLLRRIGHWGVSRKLASILNFLVHGDVEGVVDLQAY